MPRCALRLRWRVDLEGAERVGPGAAILIGNHLSALDPVVVGPEQLAGLPGGLEAWLNVNTPDELAAGSTLAAAKYATEAWMRRV